MVSAVLLQLLYALIFLISAPLRAFSDVSMPGELSTVISQINLYVSTGFEWLPLTVIAVLSTWGIFIVIEGAIFIYKGFMWIIRKIPGIN